MVIAVITAGGIGSRVGSSIPKQFIEVNGKPIIVYTLEKFQHYKKIDKIIIACLKGYEEKMMNYKKQYNLSKIEEIVVGGKTGPESISNCLDKIKEKRIAKDDDIIIVHAGTRPLVTKNLISNGISLCAKKGSAVPYINCPEILINKESKDVVDRNMVARLQTPQCFKYKDIIKAYEYAKKVNFKDIYTTADLFLNNSMKIEIYEGSNINFKITYKDDIKIFESIVKSDYYI